MAFSDAKMLLVYVVLHAMNFIVRFYRVCAGAGGKGAGKMGIRYLHAAGMCMQYM